jgi:hypothetical protein
MNSAFYNNNQRGLEFNSDTMKNIVYNSRFYNNGGTGIIGSANATGNRFYGTIRIFGNITNGATANNMSAPGVIMGLATDTEIT